MKRLSWLVVLVAACGGSSSKPGTSAPSPGAAPARSTPGPSGAQREAESPAAPAAPPVPTAACSEQASRIGAALRDLTAAQPGFLPIVQAIKAPVTRKGKPVDKRGVVVGVTADGTMYVQGSKVDGGLDELRERLDDVYKRAAETTMMDGGTQADLTVALYVWADRSAPASVIAGIAKAATLEFPRRKSVSNDKDDPPPPEEPDAPPPSMSAEDRAAREQAIQQAKDAGILGETSRKRLPYFAVRLLVTSMDKAPPLSADVGAKLPATEPASTKYVVDLLKAAVGTRCDALITTLGTASLAGRPEKEAATLVTEVPASLLKCQCNVASASDLELGMRQWFGAWAPSLQWIELPKSTEKDKRPIGKLVK